MNLGSRFLQNHPDKLALSLALLWADRLHVNIGGHLEAKACATLPKRTGLVTLDGKRC